MRLVTGIGAAGERRSEQRDDGGDRRNQASRYRQVPIARAESTRI
jgi:hypothetical protein